MAARADRRAGDYSLWLVLALPALWLVWRHLSHQPVYYVTVSGDLAAWMLVLCMMVTPVMQITGPSAGFLRRHRRHLGVAAFLYTLLHLVLWVRGADWAEFIRSISHLRIGTGWLALLLMVPLAVTSTDGMVRRLGLRWKPLQRLAYPAAILTLVHWVMVTDAMPMLVYSVLPLLALTLWRVTKPAKARKNVDSA